MGCYQGFFAMSGDMVLKTLGEEDIKYERYPADPLEIDRYLIHDIIVLEITPAHLEPVLDIKRVTIA